MNFTDFANARLAGMNHTLGLRFTDVSPDEVIAEVPIGPHLLQPYGVVHGGVYATIAETLCSVGGALTVMPSGGHAVGLDNHTSFLRAAREGVITGTATPVHRGRRTHVWEARLTDGDGQLLATSRVRLMVLAKGSSLAGESVQIMDEVLRDEADKRR